MTLRRGLLFGSLLIVGVLLGFAAAWIIQVQGAKSIAKANVFVAGEALRSGDLVTAMLHAQAVISHAPHVYDGYEFVGDVYTKQGYPEGAKRMYELALEKLASGGADALLLQEGTNSVSTATQHVQRKLASMK